MGGWGVKGTQLAWHRQEFTHISPEIFRQRSREVVSMHNASLLWEQFHTGRERAEGGERCVLGYNLSCVPTSLGEKEGTTVLRGT